MKCWGAVGLQPSMAEAVGQPHGRGSLAGNVSVYDHTGSRHADYSTEERKWELLPVSGGLGWEEGKGGGVGESAKLGCWWKCGKIPGKAFCQLRGSWADFSPFLLLKWEFLLGGVGAEPRKEWFAGWAWTLGPRKYVSACWDQGQGRKEKLKEGNWGAMGIKENKRRTQKEMSYEKEKTGERHSRSRRQGRDTFLCCWAGLPNVRIK